MLAIRAALKDLLAGGVFILFGAAFAFGSLAYDTGTPGRMGPGYVPLALGILLAGLGVAIVVKGFVAAEGDPIGAVEWRGVVLVSIGLLFFGLTVRGLGVVGALFGAVLLAALARSRTRPTTALAIAVGLTVLSVVIFIVALQLRLPLVGPWIPL